MINQPSPFGGMPPVFALVFVVIFVAIAFAILSSIFAAAGANAKNNASPILDEHAHVVTKRTAVSGHENSFTYYYATFEFENGQRTEFPVKGPEYGMLAEGDRGTLRYQGTRYLGFNRQTH